MSTFMSVRGAQRLERVQRVAHGMTPAMRSGMATVSGTLGRGEARVRGGGEPSPIVGRLDEDGPRC
jgi:hypothetical protein